MKAKDIASKRFWRRMPVSSTVNFLAAVFFIFAPMGFIMDIWRGGTLSITLVWLYVLYSGLVAIGYAFSFTRTFIAFPFTLILQFGFHFIPWGRFFPGGPESGSEIQSRLIFDGIGILVCIILAYIIFIRFITKVGIKQIELSKEMELAGDIHRVLVPDIKIDNEHFEISGKSKPTDEVGGDLIDYMGNDEETIVYMIDVSGHGVGPGLLTGMFKASFRSIYSSNNSIKSIVQKLNAVLLSQRKKGMFVTFGGLRFYDNNNVEYFVAGHPPIIKIDKSGKVEELKITQLPLLTLLHSEFQNQIISTNPGDLFIIYSDGIYETMNKKGEDFGFDRLKKIITETHTLSTDEILERIFKDLTVYGSSHDDQSLIVIRRK